MKHFIPYLLLFVVIHTAQAQQVIPLYEDAIPNSKPAPNKEKRVVRDNGTEIISDISIPTLTIFLPETPAADRTAVIIFPGGG